MEFIAEFIPIEEGANEAGPLPQERITWLRKHPESAASKRFVEFLTVLRLAADRGWVLADRDANRIQPRPRHSQQPLDQPVLRRDKSQDPCPLRHLQR